MAYSQPGIFNVLDDWGAGRMMPGNMGYAAQNTLALQATINAAQAYCASSPPGGPMYGAIILIPSNDMVPIDGSPQSVGDGGTYYIQKQSIVADYAAAITCDYPLRFLGTGNAATLHMLPLSSRDNNYGDVFRVSNTQQPGTPSPSLGGVSFENLKIEYDDSPPADFGAAIRVQSGSQNVRLFRMVLSDCPVGVALDDSLHCSIIDSQIQCDKPSVTAAVTLGTPSTSAVETYIAGCILSILQADDVRVVSTRIEAFGQGIVFNLPGNASRLFFSNDFIYPVSGIPTTGAALLIQPSVGASVTNAVFVACSLEPTSEAETMYSGPGVLLDGSGGTIDQVRFVSCYACNWNGPGLQINGGSNIEIIGGFFSCNAGFESLPSDSPPPAGIAITAARVDVSGVRIVGAGCNNSFYQASGLHSLGSGGQQPATQLYGIYIQNAENGIASNILISACDLSGNLAYGVGIDAPETSESPGVTDLFIRRCNLTGSGINAVQVVGSPEAQITDCAGYNDQAKVLPTGPPTNGGMITNASGSYYGPVAFYVGAVTGLTIAMDGEPTGLTSGAFTLGPGEFAVLAWPAGTAPSFFMVGK